MDSDDEVESLKIVLIGESGVGKTSIISQFIDQIFQDDQQSTIGGTFTTKTIKCSNGKTLKLEIWDTAGQERYRSVTKMFYKDANAVVLVYDITSKYSYEELQSYWIEQVKESCPKNIILAIIANKADLVEHEQVDEGEARNFAKELNAIFISTSAKSSEGINSLFEEIAKKYTGSTNIKIKEEGDDEPHVEEQKDTVKIDNAGKEKKQKKKGGFC